MPKRYSSRRVQRQLLITPPYDRTLCLLTR